MFPLAFELTSFLSRTLECLYVRQKTDSSHPLLVSEVELPNLHTLVSMFPGLVILENLTNTSVTSASSITISPVHWPRTSIASTPLTPIWVRDAVNQRQLTTSYSHASGGVRSGDSSDKRSANDTSSSPHSSLSPKPSSPLSISYTLQTASPSCPEFTDQGTKTRTPFPEPHNTMITLIFVRYPMLTILQNTFSYLTRHQGSTFYLIFTSPTMRFHTTQTRSCSIEFVSHSLPTPAGHWKVGISDRMTRKGIGTSHWV
jgi:hypothetical protein